MSNNFNATMITPIPNTEDKENSSFQICTPTTPRAARTYFGVDTLNDASALKSLQMPQLMDLTSKRKFVPRLRPRYETDGRRSSQQMDGPALILDR